MKSKAIILSLVLVSGLLFCSQAQAADAWFCITAHDGGSVDTLFSLIYEGGPGRDIGWVFFDEDGTHVIDGYIDLMDTEWTGCAVSWQDMAGLGLENIEGIMMFYTYTEGVPLVTEDILGGTQLMLEAWRKDANVTYDARPFVYAQGAHLTGNQQFTCFGSIDPEYSMSTLWKFIQLGDNTLDVDGDCPIIEPGTPRNITTYFYNTEGDRHSVSFYLENDVLSVIDPSEDILGLPPWANFKCVGGFAGGGNVSLFGMGVVESPYLADWYRSITHFMRIEEVE